MVVTLSTPVPRRRCSNVKPKVHHVAVLDHVFLPFESHLSRFLRALLPLALKEVRAWTIHVGDTAPQAAGVIHTDFEHGFIRAEVIAYDEFLKNKGEQGAKEAGKMRREGKEYVVKDGDVMHFLFNV